MSQCSRTSLAWDTMHAPDNGSMRRISTPKAMEDDSTMDKESLVSSVLRCKQDEKCELAGRTGYLFVAAKPNPPSSSQLNQLASPCLVFQELRSSLNGAIHAKAQKAVSREQGNSSRRCGTLATATMKLGTGFQELLGISTNVQIG